MTRPSPRTVAGRRPGAWPPDERLAFNDRPATVPGEQRVEAASAADRSRPLAIAQDAGERDWGYIGLLAFTAVLLLRPQDQIPGLTSLHLAEICALIGIGSMLLHRVSCRLPMFRVIPETVGLIGFGLVMLATAPFSIWPGGAVDLFFDSYLKIVIVFILMMNTLTTPRRLEQLTWVILLCCGYIAFRAVFDYARGMNLVEDGRVAGAVSGIFGNPNDLALNMVTFMPAALMVALTPRHAPVRRLTAAGIAAMMLATVVFTKSRGGALGLGAMLTAMLFLGRRIRPGFTVMAVAAVLLATPFVPASFWTRMATIADEQQDKTHFTGSFQARRVVMEEGIGAFLARPFTGVGAGQFKNYNPPGRREPWRETHNALIQVAAETGIFGLVAFSFLIACGAMAAARTRRMLSRPRRRGTADPIQLTMSDGDRQSLYAYAAAMTAGLVGWFTCALFASVAYSWTFYYLLALIVAARELARSRLAAARELKARRTDAARGPSARFSRERAAGAA
jgi:O-antigen ligase